MTDATVPAPRGAAAGFDTERLLTFEYDSAIYALPIAEVHEVAEVERVCCVPTIPAARVGVMNWHGEALPVVAAHLLLDAAEDDAAPQGEQDAPPGDGDPPAASDRGRDAQRRAGRGGQVLVVSGRDDEPARLGLPIDRVLGLVDGVKRRRGGHQIIVERRPLDGRVVNVLDPRGLVARATEVIGLQTA